MNQDKCEHLHWRGTKCLQCEKELTWKERWNITLRKLNQIKKNKDVLTDTEKQDLEIAEAELKALGQDYSNNL